MQIDAHQHFWQPARGDYDWMPRDNALLCRPYAPADLAPQLAAAGVAATVLVQAAATVEETEYMLGIADATPFVAGVVGWVDFQNPAQAHVIKRLSGHPKFKSLRPMIQDIPDDGWMLREDVQWAYRALIDHGLSFDALGFPRHLDNFLTLLRRYPELPVVIDHGMKPQIRTHTEQSFKTWAEGMARLAEAGAYVKLSGLVTEAAPDWRPERLAPYVNHLIEAFGADRIMWGSDWPVCRLAADYARWHEVALALTAHLPHADHARIFGCTAAAFYRIP